MMEGFIKSENVNDVMQAWLPKYTNLDTDDMPKGQKKQRSEGLLFKLVSSHGDFKSQFSAVSLVLLNDVLVQLKQDTPYQYYYIVIMRYALSTDTEEDQPVASD